MVFINSDGKFNENTYLIDAELYRMKGNLAIYIKEFGLYPIHNFDPFSF